MLLVGQLVDVEEGVHAGVGRRRRRRGRGWCGCGLGLGCEDTEATRVGSQVPAASAVRERRAVLVGREASHEALLCGTRDARPSSLIGRAVAQVRTERGIGVCRPDVAFVERHAWCGGRGPTAPDLDARGTRGRGAQTDLVAACGAWEPLAPLANGSARGARAAKGREGDARDPRADEEGHRAMHWGGVSVCGEWVCVERGERGVVGCAGVVGVGAGDDVMPSPES